MAIDSSPSLDYGLMLLLLSAFFALSQSLYDTGDPPLTLDYYAKTCPNVLQVVRKEMECAVLSDPRNAAFAVRLHFHDCFVQVPLLIHFSFILLQNIFFLFIPHLLCVSNCFLFPLGFLLFKFTFDFENMLERK